MKKVLYPRGLAEMEQRIVLNCPNIQGKYGCFSKCKFTPKGCSSASTSCGVNLHIFIQCSLNLPEYLA